jgi:hypothetical protein
MNCACVKAGIFDEVATPNERLFDLPRGPAQPILADIHDCDASIPMQVTYVEGAIYKDRLRMPATLLFE